MQIDTERLLIRELTMDDLDAVHHHLDIDLKFDDLNREQRAQWLQWTVLSYKELGRLYQPPHGEYAITLKPSSELIGLVGYVPLRMPHGMLPKDGGYHDPVVGRKIVPELGLYWTIAPAHQRKGYATEAARGMIRYAFDEMGYKRITANTDYDNEASQAVMRKVGMRLERNPYPEMPWFQVIGILENDAP